MQGSEIDFRMLQYYLPSPALMTTLPLLTDDMTIFFGPAVSRLRSAKSCPLYCSGRLMTPAAGSRGAGPQRPSMYQRRRPACPKVHQHKGAVVGPAHCADHGLAQGAARVSPKKPSRSRPVVIPARAGPSMVTVLVEAVNTVEYRLLCFLRYFSLAQGCLGRRARASARQWGMNQVS